MAFIQLIYTSTLLDKGPDAMAAILQTARHINNSRNITGMLLCANDGILQVLEGEFDDVTRTYRSIEMDKRHHDLHVISNAEISERQFASWDMGFRRLTDTEIINSPIATEVFNADKDEIAHRVKPGPVLTMLVLFGQGIEMDDPTL